MPEALLWRNQRQRDKIIDFFEDLQKKGITSLKKASVDQLIMDLAEIAMTARPEEGSSEINVKMGNISSLKKRWEAGTFTRNAEEDQAKFLEREREGVRKAAETRKRNKQNKVRRDTTTVPGGPSRSKPTPSHRADPLTVSQYSDRAPTRDSLLQGSFPGFVSQPPQQQKHAVDAARTAPSGQSSSSSNVQAPPPLQQLLNEEADLETQFEANGVKLQDLANQLKDKLNDLALRMRALDNVEGPEGKTRREQRLAMRRKLLEEQKCVMEENDSGVELHRADLERILLQLRRVRRLVAVFFHDHYICRDQLDGGSAQNMEQLYDGKWQPIRHEFGWEYNEGLPGLERETKTGNIFYRRQATIIDEEPAQPHANTLTLTMGHGHGRGRARRVDQLQGRF